MRINSLVEDCRRDREFFQIFMSAEPTYESTIGQTTNNTRETNSFSHLIEKKRDEPMRKHFPNDDKSI